MPLFGKKEKNSGAAEKSVKKAAYPTQAASYPTQGYANNDQFCQAAGAPPPYQAVAQQSYPVGHQPMMGLPQNQYMSPQSSYVSPPPPHQPPTVIVQGGFDAGARFDGVSRPNIPPPPPGSVMHPAQMAAYQGSNVVVTQKPGNFWSGGSDGGYTLY